MRILAALAASLIPLTALAQSAAAQAALTIPAPAAEPEAGRPAQPNAHLVAAQRLYQKLDLDAALAELQLAEAARIGEDEMVQVLIYRGLIYSETGKSADAADQFKRALAVRPWAEVPPETSPRIAKMFSDARKSVWGMASVKPPKRRPAKAQAPSVVVAPAPAPGSGAPQAAAAVSDSGSAKAAVPATTSAPEQPKAEPAVAK